MTLRLSSAAVSRRAFVAALPALLAAARFPESPRRKVTHPEPRTGITGENVLSGSELDDVRPKVRRIYDMAREIPGVADGIYCYCHCTAMGHRSLLSCFESRQAIGCIGCRDVMEDAYRLHREGRTLAGIRTELDRIFD